MLAAKDYFLESFHVCCFRINVVCVFYLYQHTPAKMGRRSINTTKSGKYMNPTDQARKEARKKELKKNKRQRQMVRAAVLKNKDPSQILEEMEKIDEMEYNVLQPSPLNEKVLRDKRKKLKETFDRVMRLLHNDEPEHWTELKRKEAEYEKRRLKKQQYYESVKHAQSVQVDEIPLPAPAPTSSSTVSSFTGSIRLPPPPVSLALPPFAPGAPPSVLKKADDDGPPKSGEKSTEDESKEKDLLGVPPGPPPNLFEMSDLDTDAEDDEVVLKPYSPPHKSPSRKTKQPNSLQKRMLAISGQNIDEFMREMENVHKKKHREKDAQSDVEDDDSEKSVKTSKSQSQSESDRGNDSDSDSNYKSGKRSSRDSEENTQKELPAATGTTVKNPTVAPTLIPLPPVPIAPPVNPVASAPVNIVPPHMSMPPVHGIAPPPPMLFRPPPMRPPGANIHNFGLHMPPVPPPGPRPHALGGLPSRMGIRMPPGPPPGLPPRMPHHMKPPHPHPNHQQQHQLLHSKELGKGITTITAKPQIRNLSADVTRFVPSTLRVKREEVRKPIRQKPYADRHERTIHTSASTDAKKSTTKDDAYLQFMNEMQGLL